MLQNTKIDIFWKVNQDLSWVWKREIPIKVESANYIIRLTGWRENTNIKFCSLVVRGHWNADWCAEYDMENSTKHPSKEGQQWFLGGNIIPVYNYIDTLLAQVYKSEERCESVTCSAVT